MAHAHVHDWIDPGDGTTACQVQGCQAVHHQHRYAQDARGLWCCACGAWAPKPPPPPDQVTDLSAYNVRQLKPRNPHEPRASRKTTGWR